MTDLRKLARGRMCQIRVPEICDGNPETVVLAHVRKIDISGAGMKSPDVFGAWSCMKCHLCVDGHSKSDFTADERRLMLLEGMVRTQQILISEGVLTW